MPERLPDLGLGIKGVELQPEAERNIGDQRERISESTGERKRRRDMLSTRGVMGPKFPIRVPVDHYPTRPRVPAKLLIETAEAKASHIDSLTHMRLTAGACRHCLSRPN